MKNYVCADIGACALKLGSSDRGRVAMEAVPNRLIQGGTITSYDAMAEEISKAMKSKRLGKEAAVVLPAGKVFVRTVAVSPMSEEQMKMNIPYEFRDYVGNAEKDYVFDYAVMDIERTEEGKPSQLQVLAAAVAKNTISDYTEMFRKCGMKLSVAAPEEMGYCNLVRTYLSSHKEQADEIFCFVDLGHSATRIHVLTGSVYSLNRVIDIGGQDVDQVIANELGMDVFLAHNQKELNSQNCQELPACKDVYERISVEVMRAVNFFGYNSNGKELKNLYLCGGGTNISSLMKAIAEQNPDLQMLNAELLYPQQLQGSSGGLTPAALGVAMI